MQGRKVANFGTLGKVAKDKLKNDNDIKIIIVGKNSQTGIGKTTLAIQLCRYIDPDWTAEEKAFISPEEYLNAFLEKPKGSALLLDEIEHGADRRRANSHENVGLSQGWAKLRARNIATVATLPSISMLDSRMLELADYWVLVKARGLAQPYKIRVNDFNGRVSRKPLPGDEHIRFQDIGDDDADKEYLDKIKDETVRSDNSGWIKEAEAARERKKAVEKAKEKQAKTTRNELIRDMYDNFDVTYSDIGNLPNIGMTKQTIGEIYRDDD